MSLARHEANGHRTFSERAQNGDGSADVIASAETEPAIEREQRRQFAGLVRIGCDLPTAAWTTGHAPAEVKEMLTDDGVFLRDVRKAESEFEAKHLQHLDKAAGEPKNWRVSMWLLERLLPDKYAKQRPRTIRESQLMPLLKSLAEAVVEGVEDPEQRAALIERVEATIEEMQPRMVEGVDDGA